MARGRARHETINGRFIDLAVLWDVYRHDRINLHHIFAAIAITTQLEMLHGFTPFEWFSQPDSALQRDLWQKQSKYVFRVQNATAFNQNNSSWVNSDLMIKWMITGATLVNDLNVLQCHIMNRNLIGKISATNMSRTAPFDQNISGINMSHVFHDAASLK